MNLQTMRKRVAENLGILGTDYATVIEGQITTAGIDNRLNDIYLEELFPLFSDKYPDDFVRATYPKATYTQTGTVDGASAGTTLIATAPIFDNTMENFYIENPTLSSKLKIVTFVSTTELVMSGAVDTWVGDTIYVLGNVFTFGGDTTDLKEILQLRVKYSTSQKNFIDAEPRVKKDVSRYGSEQFSTANPVWYPTNEVVGGVPKRAVGLLPYPTSYLGVWEMDYMEKPVALGAAQEPQLTNSGISETMIYGATAWAFRIQKRWDDAQYYQALYEKSKKDLIATYRPRNRSGATKIRFSTSMNARAIRSF